MMRLREGASLREVRRLAVVPFAGDWMAGGQYSGLLAKGLRELEFDVVWETQMESVLRQLSMRKGEPVGPQSAAALRRMTRADAVVFGYVDCGRGKQPGRVSVLFLDGTADPVARLTGPAGACEDKASMASSVRGFVDAIGRASKRTRRSEER